MFDEITLVVNQAAEIKIKKGACWLSMRDIEKRRGSGAVAAGAPTLFINGQYKFVARGYFNPYSKIPGRVLTRANQVIDKNWLSMALIRADQRRVAMYGAPYYRMVFGDSDNLSGLIIDRYNDNYVMQITTAGMKLREAELVDILKNNFRADTVFRIYSSPDMEAEQLPASGMEVLAGDHVAPIRFEENECLFMTDPLHAQKTGWFFDQRDNHAWFATQAKEKNVADLFSYQGGFGVQAAKKGAASVVFVDRSQDALDACQDNMRLNNLSTPFEIIRANVFDQIATWKEEGKKFDLVSVDPPAFIKKQKDKVTGEKGYEKLFRQSLDIVAENGTILFSSCSHHLDKQTMRRICDSVIEQSGRKGRIVFEGRAGQDHPIHPMLPETNYLKALGYKLDNG